MTKEQAFRILEKHYPVEHYYNSKDEKEGFFQLWFLHKDWIEPRKQNFIIKEESDGDEEGNLKVAYFQVGIFNTNYDWVTQIRTKPEEKWELVIKIDDTGNFNEFIQIDIKYLTEAVLEEIFLGYKLTTIADWKAILREEQINSVINDD